MWNDDSPTIAKEQKATEATETAVNEPVDPPVAEVVLAQLQALRDRLDDIVDAAKVCAAQDDDSAPFSSCFLAEVARRSQIRLTGQRDLDPEHPERALTWRAHDASA